MLKNTLLLFIFLLLENHACIGQNVNWVVSDTGVSDYCRGDAIHSDVNGDVYICGSFYAHYHGSSPAGAFISKYSALGNLTWNHLIYNATINKGLTDLQGNTYLIGLANGMVDFGNSLIANNTPFLVKYDLNGSCLWLKTTNNAILRALTVDSDGSIYLTGNDFYYPWSWDGGCSITPNGSGLFILKLDSSGNCLWASHSDGLGTSKIVELDNNENPVIAGIIQADIKFGTDADTITLVKSQKLFVASYNSNDGSLIKAIGLCDSAYIIDISSIDFDTQNSLYAAGVYNNTVIFNGVLLNSGMSDGYTLEDIYIVKMDSSDTFQYVRQLAGTEQIIKTVKGLEVRNDRYYIAGELGINYDFGMSGDSTKVYLAAFNESNGSVISTKTYSSNPFMYGSSHPNAGGFSTDQSTSVYLTGSFVGPVGFDSYTVTQTDEYYTDMFLLKIVDPAISVETMNDSDYSFNVYPNPNSGVFNFAYEGELSVKKMNLKIQNTLGKTIYFTSATILSNVYKKSIDLSKEDKGIYFVEIIVDGKRSVKKIVLN